jgi:hypothetical protein
MDNFLLKLVLFCFDFMLFKKLFCWGCITLTKVLMIYNISYWNLPLNMMHGWYAKDFKTLRVLEHRWTPTVEVWKILFAENLVGEKRRKRLHIVECRGTWKQWSCGLGWGVGFYSLFLHCLRAEMPFRCKQAFPREKYLLDHLSPFGTSCSPTFSPSFPSLKGCPNRY